MALELWGLPRLWSCLGSYACPKTFFFKENYHSPSLGGHQKREGEATASRTTVLSPRGPWATTVSIWFLPRKTGCLVTVGGVESSDLGRANPQGGGSLFQAFPPLPPLPSLTSQTWKQKPGGVASGCSSLLQWVGTGQVPGVPVCWQAWGSGSAQTQVGSPWSRMARPLPSCQPMCLAFREVPVQSRLWEGACSLRPSTSGCDCRRC